MASLNQVMLLGNLGKDPECRDAKGITISRISMATQRFSKSQGKQVTDWHSVTLFGQPAKFALSQLRKGDSVLIEGYLQTSEWKDSEGKIRYSTDIIGEKIQCIKIKERNALENNLETI